MVSRLRAGTWTWPPHASGCTQLIEGVPVLRVLTYACGSVAHTSLCAKQTYYSLKMRFSVTLGEEPDMDVELA